MTGQPPKAHATLTEATLLLGRVPKVSVIVPMFNERRHVGKCLDSLLESDYPEDRLEVLVVDGGSTDGSRQMVLERAAGSGRIRLISNPKRVAAAGLNTGLENSSGEVIILMSAHGYVAPDFVSRSVLHLHSTDAACVGGSIRSVSESFWGQTIALALSSPFGVGDALFRYAQRQQYVDTVAFGAYRRELLEDLGGFDESLTCNEDDELNCRVRMRGGTILLVPSITSYYYTRDTLSKLWRQWYRYGRGKVTVVRRYPSAAKIRQFVPATLVTTLMITGLLGLASPPLLMICGLELASYLAVSLLFSFRIAARHGWRYLPLLPPTFATVHFAYGLGFLAGLLSLVIRHGRT